MASSLTRVINSDPNGRGLDFHALIVNVFSPQGTSLKIDDRSLHVVPETKAPGSNSILALPGSNSSELLNVIRASVVVRGGLQNAQNFLIPLRQFGVMPHQLSIGPVKAACSEHGKMARHLLWCPSLLCLAINRGGNSSNSSSAGRTRPARMSSLLFSICRCMAESWISR